MVDVEEVEGGCDDRADPPGAQADVAQGVEGGLEQGVAAFPDRTFSVVGLVVILLLSGEFAALGFLESHGDGAGLSRVTQIA